MGAILKEAILKTRKPLWLRMGNKGRVLLAVILVTVMDIIIDSIVPECNLRSVLNGLSVGITVLVVNIFAGKSKTNFKDKIRR